MTKHHLAARILYVMSLPENRGRWMDTREIANKVHRTPWADQVEMARVRQSLRKLEVKGKVERFGGAFAEWRLYVKFSADVPNQVKLALEMNEILPR